MLPRTGDRWLASYVRYSQYYTLI
uniref:ORF IIA n=1 Tax=Cucumber mosaic virus TaxID=12305 RepID=Q89720_9BROM|nr:ORF IIA [Cucumber mosaic virus]AAA46392.1 ORF IIA [Cucumber mosaic virus]AAA46395.1 ORF IIA [Cucumber mosaic virus]AAA46398.1 ORF IIA [Cucumber mosaic virus]